MRFLSLIAPLSLTACIAGTTAEDVLPCEGKCDDGSSAAPLVSCWVVPGASDDPFFTVDELVCSRGSGAIYDLVTINVLSAGNDSAGEILDAASAAPVTILKFPRDRGYPLRVTAQLSDSTSRVNSVLPVSLKTESTIADHAATSAEAPLEWRVPFRVGDVVVDSHVDQGTLAFDYQLDLAPFVDSRGASSVQIRKSAELSFGRQVRLELPSRGGRIAATVGARAVELPGFGHFALTASDVSAVAEPTGATVVRCTASEPTSAGTRAVRCTLVTPGEHVSVTGTATAGDAAAVSLSADTEVMIGEVPAAAFPLTVTVKATLASVGASVLDPAVAGRELELAVTVPSVPDSVATGRLGLDLWSTTLTCAEELCMIDRDGFVLPLPTRGQWATRVSEDNVVNLGNNDQATFVFASPTGERCLTGKRVLLVDGDLDEQPVRVEPGSYRLDRGGLTLAP